MSVKNSLCRDQLSFWELVNYHVWVLFEGKCFKFFYEFFYGVFKVGLNTQQNSPTNSLLCYTKFHNKIEPKFCRNCTKQTCLCLFRVLAGTEIFIVHHALNRGTSILHVNFMKIMFLRALISPFTNSQICKRPNNLSFCQFPRPDHCLIQPDHVHFNHSICYLPCKFHEEYEVDTQ